MLNSFKITTAFAICLAFLFRLFFANICMVPSFNASQNGKGLSAHYTSLPKKRKRVETEVSTNVQLISNVEDDEEDFDGEKDIVRLGSPALLSTFYSFLKPVSDLHFPSDGNDLIKCSLFPKRYLALSILRL